MTEYELLDLVESVNANTITAASPCSIQDTTPTLLMFTTSMEISQLMVRLADLYGVAALLNASILK